MNIFFNLVYRVGIKIIPALCILLTVLSCKTEEETFTQQQIDAFIASNQNQFIYLSQDITGDNPPSVTSPYILKSIFHMPTSDGSRLFFEIDIFDKDDKLYEIDDMKYNDLFFKLIGKNKISSNVLGYDSDFDLLKVSDSEIFFSNEDTKYSLKTVTESSVIESLKNAPKVDTDYLKMEYNGIWLP